MTDFGNSVAPGWYYAHGDPPGTQRYWDGELWRGEPVPVPNANPPGPGIGQWDNAGFAAAAHEPQYVYQSNLPREVPVIPLDQLASYGRRALGAIVDLALWLPAFIVVGATADDNDQITSTGETIGIILLGVTALAQIANLWILQGITGRSLGKMVAGTQIVQDKDREVVGVGLMIARLMLRGILSTFTCYLYWLLDWLWPIWDQENKRLTDKMLKLSVINAALKNSG